jgi:glycosyltransferase involved in cell wall biosynthesis
MIRSENPPRKPEARDRPATARPLRVLMVSHLFPPAPAGGSEIQAARLARGLDRHGVDVVVATASTLPAQPDPRSTLRIVRFRSKADPRGSSSLRQLTHAATVYRTVATLVREADVFHLHGLHFLRTTLPALMAARRFGIPCVLKLPSNGPEEFFEYYGRLPFSGRIHRWVVNCDAIVAVCKAGRERALQAGLDPRRVHHIPNGIELSAGGGEGATIQDIERERSFLFCSSLDRRRGWDVLLEAWERAAPRLDGWTLRIAGYHADEQRVRNELERQFRDRVVFHGYVQDVSALMRRATCLVRPARIEGLSNAVLEAMRLRTPVIASDTGGNPELIRHGWNGLLFPNDNAERLAGSLVEMAAYTSEQRARMGENAYRHVLPKFSMERVVAAYLDLYRQLVA